MDELERTVGRLEGKIESGFDDLVGRIDRIDQKLIAEGGIDSRLRECEGEMREIKARAGLISFIISVLIGVSWWIVRFFNGR